MVITKKFLPLLIPPLVSSPLRRGGDASGCLYIQALGQSSLVCNGSAPIAPNLRLYLSPVGIFSKTFIISAKGYMCYFEIVSSANSLPPFPTNSNAMEVLKCKTCAAASNHTEMEARPYDDPNTILCIHLFLPQAHKTRFSL